MIGDIEEMRQTGFDDTLKIAEYKDDAKDGRFLTSRTGWMVVNSLTDAWKRTKFSGVKNKDFGLGHIEFEFIVPLRHARTDVKKAVQY